MASITNKNSTQRINREARPSQHESKALDEHQIAVIENLGSIMASALRDIRESTRLTNKKLADRLYPTINSGNVISKMIARAEPWNAAIDTRPINPEHLAALYFMFGFDFGKMLEDALAEERAKPQK